MYMYKTQVDVMVLYFSKNIFLKNAICYQRLVRIVKKDCHLKHLKDNRKAFAHCVPTGMATFNSVLNQNFLNPLYRRGNQHCTKNTHAGAYAIGKQVGEVAAAPGEYVLLYQFNNAAIGNHHHNN